MLQFFIDRLQSLLESLIQFINRYFLCDKYIFLRRAIPVLPFHENGLIDLVGNTPMIKLPRLSALTGCTILAKLEYLNPGGSSKDRFAKALLTQLKSTKDHCYKEIVEGSSGSTGISLSLLCKLFGYRCSIFMSSEQSIEKRHWMTLYGCQLFTVDPASFVSPEHFVKRAEEYVAEDSSTRFYADQFENAINEKCHYETTGPEIWEQTNGMVSAVVLSAGTAGTLAGVSQYLKEVSAGNVQIYVADPPGSGIVNMVHYGTMWSPCEAEGKRTRNQVDSLVQGVGLNRITSLLADSVIDDAFLIPDSDTLSMASYLLNVEGLFVGSSSALNMAAVVKAAKKLGPGHTIVTLFSDAGYRHWSSLWSSIDLSNPDSNSYSF